MFFYLAESCENTFVLCDCIGLSELDETFYHQAHQRLVKEKRDDALILVDGRIQGKKFSAQMVVLGLDGTVGEFCGNGARACAAYLFAFYPQFESISLRTARGDHQLTQSGGNIYSVKLPPASFEWNVKFVSDPLLCRKQYPFVYVETIEPHLIIEREMEDEELFTIGRRLNLQKDLFPLGINVNAWHVLEKGSISVKTYERGVQRLTRSCGTGSTACAAYYQGFGTVRVATPGGSLKVVFRRSEVELFGESQITRAV